MDTCYQSMRPTNYLVDAVNNTSLAPLDLGDGPDGTRVAGHAAVAVERFTRARKLQSKQAIRAANFVLQSGDPGGINAAGPGANVGQGMVYNYAGEILSSAWKATGEPKYFRGLEEKERKSLDDDPKYTDDLGYWVELLLRHFPRDYPAVVKEVARKEDATPEETAERVEAARQLAARIRRQIDADLGRLCAIQLEDGSWSFDPGASTDDGKTWMVKDTKALSFS